MALIKQPVEINFAKGLDTKTDPYQVPVGNFLRLQNSVFDKYGRLTKRNGFGQLSTLPNPESFITTFNGNLTAVDKRLLAYAEGPNIWFNKGDLQPASLSVLPLIRSNTNQTQVDTAVSPNNLICVVYTDMGPSSTTYKYALFDSITGQNILPPAAIPSNSSTASSPRVFLLNNYFVIVSATSNTLEFSTINIANPVAPVTATTITTQITPTSNLNWDGVVANNILYLAWNGSDIGGAIRSLFITHTLAMSSTHVTSGRAASLMSLSADMATGLPSIYISWLDSGNGNTYTEVRDHNLNLILSPTAILTGVVISNITAVANAGLQTVFYEIPNNYSYDSSIPSHYIKSVTCTSTGTVGTPVFVDRSVGIASKAFTINGITYLLAVYQSPFQPTYFLINASGQVISRFAYSNAGGYKTLGLPSVSISGSSFTVGYQFADLIQAVNKTQGAANAAGVYTQLGLNAVTFTLDSAPAFSEIGSTLNITGGFLWSYDGYVPVEQNFFLWPDSVEATQSNSTGTLTDQQYFYQVTYEWTDNQGNIQRSAPSVPVGVNLVNPNNTITLNIPTYRLTYKLANPVKIVIYRWSAGQQNYFQVTSITQPLLNSVTTDSVQFIDTQPDSAILGNALIYTTGGVVENIGAPAFNAVTLFDSRLWGIAAEDPNLLWYSKQVIEATPVEMSDLFTKYTAPTTGAQGSTGLTKCIFPMDEKLILFKRDSIAYINGNGPDNVGTNSTYSEPTFVTSTVGCENQRSLVMSPAGIIFQSDKGIWLLNRGLATQYIGAPVESFTQGAIVLSAINVPGTNQIRFTMDSGITLMYDYFFDQWGTFTNIPAVSSTLYQNLHTYIDSSGNVFQETPGKYLDGSNPVLQSFTTSWIKVAGLIGFQRAYFMNMLGTYISPHKLVVNLTYDYDSSINYRIPVTPINSPNNWGSDPLWGSSSPWGGPTNIEKLRVFFPKQKCTSIQVAIDEVFDSSFSTVAGEGLTLSGLNITVGVKKSYPTPRASQSFG